MNKQSKLTQSQALILKMSAAALFGKQTTIPDDADWCDIMQECRYQSIPLQIFSFAQHDMPEDIRKQWQRLCTAVAANNMRLEKEHVQIGSLMEAAQIPYAVMKGYVSSSFYPDPTLRVMGDVDFLVQKQDLERVDAVLKQAGYEKKAEQEERIHYTYYKNKNGRMSVWEMHWEPNGIPDGEIGGKVRKYLNSCISESMQYRTVFGEFKGTAEFYHGLIMLMHTATHLINTGIGLRHLCDWAVFVAAITDEDFCNMFEEKLKEVGLWRFAQILTQLAVVYLGCPAKAWMGIPDEEMLELLIKDVFAGGNFGRKDQQRINQAKLLTDKGSGKVENGSYTKQLFRTLTEKTVGVFPAMERFRFLLPLGWLYVGVRHGMRIAAGRRPKINVKQVLSGANERKNIYQQLALFEVTHQEQA